ncbi:MAG: hypothetical protein M0P69_05925 [Bacteroidales bacterium]|nr:hypothetical protein [Bacteroidales bacterium]
MNKLFAILVIGFFMVGCGTLQVKNPVCENAPECSLICQKIPEPESVDLLLKLANDEMLYRGTYTVAQASDFLDRIEGYVMDITTYSGLILAVNRELELLPLLIRNKLFILADATYEINVALPICDFDRGLILKEIAEQRKMLLMY